jgi:hypothetical protein
MVELLQKIMNKEPEYEHSLTEDDFVSEDVGAELIEIYQSTTNLETRELITGFMHEAGYNWLRRLMTRDAKYQVV